MFGGLGIDGENKAMIKNNRGIKDRSLFSAVLGRAVVFRKRKKISCESAELVMTPAFFADTNLQKNSLPVNLSEDDICVCCGNYVFDGGMVCDNCRRKFYAITDTKDGF